MIRKKIVYLFTVLFLGTICLLLFKLKQSRDESKYYFNAAKNSNNFMVSLLEGAKIKELSMIGLRLPNVIIDGEFGPVSIKDVIRQSEKFIFRFSQLNCSSCLDYQLSMLKKYSNEIGAENIIIVASCPEYRQLKVYTQEINPAIKIFTIKEKGFGNLPVEKDNIPYYLIVDSNLRITHSFVPLLEEHQLTNLFYKEALTKYFK
jgi:hypothetical protein